MSAALALPLNRDEPLSTLLAGVTLDPSGNRAGQIRRLLEGLIVSVRVLPGQLISEKEIADCLGASKTPVREALIGLQDDGLVTVVPKSGTYVNPIRISAYLEALFVRLQLEIGAVRRAAERHEDIARLAELKTLLARQSDAIERGDDRLFFALGERLHEAFFGMAGVPGVWTMLRRTQSDVIRIRHLMRLLGVHRVGNAMAEHREIVAAIEDGDPDAAEAALIGHIGPLERELDRLAGHRELMAFIEAQTPIGGRSRAPAAPAG